MVTVSVNNPLRFLQQVLVDLLSLSELHAVIGPGRSLRLKIDAKFVGSDEGCLWRTIGMEPHVVQTVFLHLRKDTHPRGLVGGRIAGLGEATVLHRTAKPYRTVVDIELAPLYPHLPEAEGRLIIVVTQADAYLIKLRAELVPEHQFLTNGDANLYPITSNLLIEAV